MIPPAVWNDSGIDDMKLTDAPAVEPRSGKSSSDIRSSLAWMFPHRTPRPRIATCRRSPCISVMQNPREARRFAVYPFDVEQRNIGEMVKDTDCNFKGASVRTQDLLIAYKICRSPRRT